jgi:hypothetical protein
MIIGCNTMTEQQYLERIADLWPCAGETPTQELVELGTAAVNDFPSSPGLLCLRGDLYQLEVPAGSDHFDPNIPLQLYQRALSLDNANADALTEIGYIYDTYFDDYARAEGAFRAAIALGSDHMSYSGLARVLAEVGRSNEALSLLSPDQCPYSDHPSIRDLRREIVEGCWAPIEGEAGVADQQA